MRSPLGERARGALGPIAQASRGTGIGPDAGAAGRRDLLGRRTRDPSIRGPAASRSSRSIRSTGIGSRPKSSNSWFRTSSVGHIPVGDDPMRRSIAGPVRTTVPDRAWALGPIETAGRIGSASNAPEKGRRARCRPRSIRRS